MKANRLGRSIALVATMVTALSVLALPAFGKATKGTASITAVQGAATGGTAARQILAGTTNAVFTIQVTNAPTPSPVPPGSPAPTPYNLVSIIPPPGLYVSVQGVPPAGWTQQVSTEGDVIFETNSAADRIAAGQSKSFGVEVHVGRPALDETRDWVVQASDNLGQQLVRQDPAATGSLSSVIKVLKVVTAEITAPTGAADHSVTEQQSNTLMVSRVQNAGSGNLTVLPTLSKASGGSSITVGTPRNGAGSACPCGLGPESEVLFTFPVTFGGATGAAPNGPMVVRGGASGDTDPSRVPDSARATAITANSPAITVMTQTALTYVNNSLQPTRVASGKPYAFQVTLSKGGAVSSTLNQAATTLKFGPAGGAEFSAPLDQPTGLQGGDTGNVLFSFANTTIPTAIPDSKSGYGPRITVTGTDENDHSFTINPTVGNSIIVDSLGPIIDSVLTTRASSVEGATPATTDGATLGMRIDIKEDETTPCSSCSLDKAVLRQLGPSGVDLGKDIDVKAEFTNAGGTWTGEYNGNYDPAAAFVLLVVTSGDTTEPPNTTVDDPSARVEVDNISPALSNAKTGGPSGQDLRRIDLCFTERVGSPAVLARDYRVDGHTVQTATPTNRNGSAASSAGFDCVQLGLGEDLNRNAEPNVTYNPEVLAAVAPARNFDRVDQNMANEVLKAVDGIIPRQPIIQAISNQNYGLQGPWTDGAFYSNDTTPEVQIALIDAGDLVTLYRDVNDNGTIEDGADEELGSAVAQGGTVSITSRSIGTAPADPEVGLLVEVVDPRFNAGPLGGARLVFDFVPPEATAAVVNAGNRNNVDVSFDDILRFGRDFAIDWRLFGLKSGLTVRFTVGEVTHSGGEGGSGARTLVIDDATYSSDLTADVTEVKYDFLKAANDRYKDRAGNDLADFALTV
jgi:hypothetical protein